MLKKSILGQDNRKIVTVDPYSLISFEHQNNLVSRGNVKNFDQKGFYNSYVQTKDIISSTVDIENEIGEDDLKDAIEIKAYDELGLESTKEYSIFYFESNRTDSDYRVFNVIAIDKERLDEIFGELKDIKYIDYITAAPFLMQSLYKRNVLPGEGVQCYIYFHIDDAFVAIYQSGEYIFSKSIKYSLKNIADTFSKELGKRVDEAELFSMLKKTGLRNENAAYQQQLMKLFGEVFVYINDVLSYAKRAYGLGKIDQIYMDTEIGTIAGMNEFCINYLNIPTKQFDFKISKNANEVTIDSLHMLMIINAQEIQHNNEENLNISIFKRPPPFKDRPSGKLMQAIAASLLLSLAYPTYQFVYENFYLKTELQDLNGKHQDLSARVETMKSELSKVQKSNDEIEAKLVAKNEDLEFRTKLLKEIYSKKVSYPMKAKVLTDLFDKINKHNTKVVEVLNNDHEMIVTVQSKDDKLVTELMKEISITNGYEVSTELIKKDDNTSTYESAIKVGLHGSF